MYEKNRDELYWRIPSSQWVVVTAALTLLIYLNSDGLAHMVTTWDEKEEYGYGYMIPVISIFFIWQLKNELVKIEFIVSWIGVALLLFGGALLLLGDLATLFIIVQYSFLISDF